MRAEAPPPEVVVRAMRRRHLPGVLAIEHRVHHPPWSAGTFAAELAAGDGRRYLVAQQPRGWRTRVVGYAGMLTGGGEAHVSTVAVDPDAQRRRVATRLLVRLLAEARELGVERASLEVRASNRGAQRLYSRFGFAPVGLRPRYYPGDGEDALVMWLDDLQSDAYAARLARQAARVAAADAGADERADAARGGRR